MDMEKLTGLREGIALKGRHFHFYASGSHIITEFPELIFVHIRLLRFFGIPLSRSVVVGDDNIKVIALRVGKIKVLAGKLRLSRIKMIGSEGAVGCSA